MQVAIALFEGFTMLDAVGPYSVLSNVPGLEIVTVAEQSGPVRDDREQHMVAEATFADVRRPDVIVVPGGLITRRMARDGHPVIDWVRDVHPTTTWTTSVCTGSILLAAAGVLDDTDATSHWLVKDQLRALGAKPVDERVVRRGRVVTAAGVSSGIDMALTLVALDQGDLVAQAVQLGIEYDPQPPFDAGSPASAPEPIVQLVGDMMRAREEEILNA
ncbi:DJ-1/PfpI family protein [Nocardioides speluncae]|uniref:DJ-1/PfpI family protein n=1 Tax=Nocardioides speluncae TaxID=2670337 RepID=UPI000D696F3C|nr:DJ-1/PfpI family protein [Nocardioides speluncae]